MTCGMSERICARYVCQAQNQRLGLRRRIRPQETGGQVGPGPGRLELPQRKKRPALGYGKLGIAGQNGFGQRVEPAVQGGELAVVDGTWGRQPQDAFDLTPILHRQEMIQRLVRVAVLLEPPGGPAMQCRQVQPLPLRLQQVAEEPV